MADEPTNRDAPVEPAPSFTPVRAVPPVTSSPVDTGYTTAGVPTFDSVREKIETRFGTALGASELDAETTAGRDVEARYEARQRAAADRLAQIRESMKRDN